MRAGLAFLLVMQIFTKAQTAADCGSGIGRVTKNLLIRYFNDVTFKIAI
jgi:hypothetical protein